MMTQFVVGAHVDKLGRRSIYQKQYRFYSGSICLIMNMKPQTGEFTSVWLNWKAYINAK